jgi:hypothetical protein
VLTLSVALGGCAAWSSRFYTGSDHLAFLSQALEADPRAREALWRGLAGGEPTEDRQLRIALLQSLPHHSGYDPAAARAQLDVLATRKPASREVTAIARLRLAELDESAECRTETTELRARLARVVDIERRMNRDN